MPSVVNKTTQCPHCHKTNSTPSTTTQVKCGKCGKPYIVFNMDRKKF